MPLIDDIGVVPFSTKKQLVNVPNAPAVGHTFCGDIIEALKNALAFCGWNLTSRLRATATIEYPLGFPTSTGGSGNVGCNGGWVQISTPILTYRFCSYAAGQNPIGVGCFQFELGASVLDSLSSLTASIDFWSPYNATLGLASNGITYVISLVAKTAGPGNNYDTVGADGRFGIASGTVTGGGYIFESVGPSDYTVQVTGEIGIAGEEVLGIETTLGPLGHVGTVDYFLHTLGVTGYNIVANPYSFAIFDGTLPLQPLHSFAVFAPCIPTNEGFTAAYAVAVVGTNNLTNRLMWDGYDTPTAVCLDNNPAVFGNNFSGPGVMSLRSTPGGFPLRGLDGRPLSTAAYLLMGSARVSTPYVVGKLWDCMVITDVMQVGGTLQSGGRDFVCIATQDGASGKTRGSLLFCYNDNGNPSAGDGGSGGSTDTGGSGGGGGGSPSVPTAPPGSGNGTKSGACTATGIPDNFTINWGSGDKFDSSMIGKTITITLPWLAHPWVSAGGGGDAGGSLPVIASITSPTVLRTTLALNSAFDSAPYTCP